MAITGLTDLIQKLLNFTRRGDFDVNFLTDRILAWAAEFGERRLLSAILVEINMMDASSSQPGLVKMCALLARKRPVIFASLIGMVEQIIGKNAICLKLNNLVDSNDKGSIREMCLSIMAEIYINEIREDIKGKNNAFERPEMAAMSDESDDEQVKSSINAKDRAFAIICDHIHDRNSYVRSHAIKMFTTIIREVPLPHVGKFYGKIVERFDDRISLVRKTAVNTFIDVITNNPLIPQLVNISILRNQVTLAAIAETRRTLSLLLTDCESLMTCIARGSTIILEQHLNSVHSSDTILAINWFYQLTVINIAEGSHDGFKKMITHVWNHDHTISELVLRCYKEIYFNEELNGYEAAKKLVQLVKGSSVAEAASIAKMVQIIGISEDMRHEIWSFAFRRGENYYADVFFRAAAISIIEMESNGLPEKLDDATIKSLICVIKEPECHPVILTEIFRTLTNLRQNSPTLVSSSTFIAYDDIFTSSSTKINALLRTNCCTGLDNMLLAAVRMYYSMRKV
jgi:hypothetical protein